MCNLSLYIVDHLKIAMYDRNMSIEDLSRLVDIKSFNLQRIFDGKYDIPLNVLERLLVVLNLDLIIR